MGCCGGDKDVAVEEEEKRSRAIDRKLQEYRNEERRECKILLLGAENSGKSTVVKQMKIIHQNGYTMNELVKYRSVIYTNVIECARALIEGIRHLGIEMEDPENEENCQYLMGYALDPDPKAAIEQRVGDAVAALWSDPCMPKVLEQSNEFYMLDSAPYFFEEVRRITSPNYTPTESDVLRSRTQTTGISETRFAMGALRIHMFDVGGQRSERRKWVHCFENVLSVIFVVALSEYDQVLFEESSQNRIMEAIVLFDSVINSRWFTRTAFMLFLNKMDLFQDKLPRSPLGNHFPDYTDGIDVDKAKEYFAQRFIQVDRGNRGAENGIYVHFTQATDTSNIRFVFNAIKDTIVQQTLKDLILF